MWQMMSSRWRDCAVAPGRILKTEVLFSWGLLGLCSCLSPTWWCAIERSQRGLLASGSPALSETMGEKMLQISREI